MAKVCRPVTSELLISEQGISRSGPEAAAVIESDALAIPPPQRPRGRPSAKSPNLPSGGLTPATGRLRTGRTPQRAAGAGGQATGKTPVRPGVLKAQVHARDRPTRPFHPPSGRLPWRARRPKPAPDSNCPARVAPQARRGQSPSPPRGSPSQACEFISHGCEIGSPTCESDSQPCESLSQV